MTNFIIDDMRKGRSWYCFIGMSDVVTQFVSLDKQVVTSIRLHNRVGAELVPVVYTAMRFIARAISQTRNQL